MRTCACGNILDTKEERGSGLCDTCYLKQQKGSHGERIELPADGDATPVT
jgi:hypothetical protein